MGIAASFQMSCRMEEVYEHYAVELFWNHESTEKNYAYIYIYSYAPLSLHIYIYIYTYAHAHVYTHILCASSMSTRNRAVISAVDKHLG